MNLKNFFENNFSFLSDISVSPDNDLLTARLTGDISLMLLAELEDNLLSIEYTYWFTDDDLDSYSPEILVSKYSLDDTSLSSLISNDILNMVKKNEKEQ